MTGMAEDDNTPEYQPGARVRVGLTRKLGEVQRSFDVNGTWNYYVAMDEDGRGITCTGEILRSTAVKP